MFESAPTIAWVEARDWSWNGAANALISSLKSAGVKRGQIISIDAHNNGNDEEAIFSAFYSLAYPSLGDLDITYDVQNTGDYGWARFYDNAISSAQEYLADTISITFSNNEKGRGVGYVFRYSPAASYSPRHALSWRESRAGSWNGAADDIIAKIKETGAQRGQVISIDAHNNDPDSDAIFSAVIDLNAPGYGPLDIGYVQQNTAEYGWGAFYNNAASAANDKHVISITSSINEQGRGVTYVFHYI